MSNRPASFIASDTGRHRAAELIRKLRAITREAGATEAEALTAAEKARRLAETWGIDAGGEPVAEARVSTGRVRMRPMDRLWPAIGRFCRVEVLLLTGGDLEVAYVGRPADVLLAEWLHSFLKRHIERSLQEFKGRAEYRRRKPHRRRVAAAAFVEAAVQSLCRRLCEAAALPSAQLEEAQQWIARKYGELQDARIPSIRDSRLDGARRAGAEAGRAVPISMPIDPAPAPIALIGG